MTTHDLWHWCAVYTDGDALHEWDSEDRHHAQSEIAWERVTTFWLLPQVPDLPHAVVRPTGQVRVVFFRRRNVTYPSVEEQAGETRTLHVLGLRQMVGERPVESFTFLFPDGSVLVSNDRDVTDG